MEKLCTDSDMISRVNPQRDDLDCHLFSIEAIEATVEEYLNQFKSRVRQHASDLEANVEEYLRTLIQSLKEEERLSPESKTLDLDKRHEVRLEFFKKLARKIKLLALRQVGFKNDTVYQLISRNFSKLRIEDIERAPKEQMEQFESMEREALNDKLDKCFLLKEELDDKRLKEELDKRFEEFAKDIELKVKQIEDQLLDLKVRDKYFTEQLEEVKKKHEDMKRQKSHDQYLATNANLSAKTAVAGNLPTNRPKKRQASSPAVHHMYNVAHNQPVQHPAPGVRVFPPGLLLRPGLEFWWAVIDEPALLQQPAVQTTPSRRFWLAAIDRQALYHALQHLPGLIQRQPNHRAAGLCNSLVQQPAPGVRVFSPGIVITPGIEFWFAVIDQEQALLQQPAVQTTPAREFWLAAIDQQALYQILQKIPGLIQQQPRTSTSLDPSQNSSKQRPASSS